MHFCPRCGKPGYMTMGAGNFICVDHECGCHWSDNDGEVVIHD